MRKPKVSLEEIKRTEAGLVLMKTDVTTGEIKLEILPDILKIEELKSEALQTLKHALKATDKTGTPSKVAVDAAKFIHASSSIKDSDEYKKMISSFRDIVMSHRKKDTDAAKALEEKTESI